MTQDILDTVDFDEEGYLIDPDDWSEELGRAIADALEVELTDRHWQVIHFARKDFQETGDPPGLRRIAESTGISMREIYKLFPDGPAKLAANIAGLQKPTGCI
ncbi:MAG: TusE/DsrC/DsvC family sulfur relay protein [Anaerolineales bacterium]|jgi:TusE/DsrC/DsvC family sulfur relay protein